MKKLLALSLFVSPFLIQAQSITPEVIASSGGHFENGNVQLSWTLGEIAVSTYDNGSNIITEGFHQSDLIITAIDEVLTTDLNVNIYPNPTAFFINLEFGNNENPINAVLFDMNGKQIMKTDIKAAQTKAGMDVSNLAAGQYILKLQEENGDYHSSHQLQKTK